jgi:cell division protein FtsB
MTSESERPDQSTPPRRRPEATPRRRKPVTARPAVPLRRRIARGAILFVGVVLLVDGLVGERGLLETLRARETARAQVARLATLRAENEALREQIRRLKEDPATIEAEARRQLGLIRKGELLFIVKDAPSPAPAPAAGR